MTGTRKYRRIACPCPAEAVEYLRGDGDQAIALGQLNLRDARLFSHMGRYLVRPCQCAQLVGHAEHHAAAAGR